MDYSEEQLAVISAQQDNILPITSVCNLDCRFCSHKGNPAAVKTFASGHRPLEKIENLIDFLSAGQKIIIGESATKIEEGEPFSHPDFAEVLDLLRAKFPETTIQITTNGSRLSKKNIDLLEKIGEIELNISLNSATKEGRKRLMNDQSPRLVQQGIKLLAQLDIDYHGSIVAMPHLIEWTDLKETIAYFNRYGAQTVRVFLPGYTKYSPDKIKFELGLWQELESFIAGCNKEYQVPIILEPAPVDDLTAVIEGVIANSPADEAGLKRGDKILTIEGREVESRVDAFNKLLDYAEPELLVMRQGQQKKFKLMKKEGIKAGAVLHYDLAPQFFKQLRQVVNNYQAEKVLLLTSQLAQARIKEAVVKIGLAKKIEVRAVKSSFFGGSILSAGLLTVEDFKAALTNYAGDLAEVELILLPEVAFDFRGFDLTGVSYDKLAAELGVRIELLG